MATKWLISLISALFFIVVNPSVYSYGVSDVQPLCLNDLPELIREGHLTLHIETHFRSVKKQYEKSRVAIEKHEKDEVSHFWGQVLSEYLVLTVAHGADNEGATYYVKFDNRVSLARLVVRDEKLALAVLRTGQSLYNFGAVPVTFDTTPLRPCEPVFMLEPESKETGIVLETIYDYAGEKPYDDIHSPEDFEETIQGLTLRFYPGMSGSGVYKNGFLGILDQYGLDHTFGMYIPAPIIKMFLERNVHLFR